MSTKTPRTTITKGEKVYLMILDGFGIGKKYKGNAIENAKMPFYRKLLKEYPHTKLKASGNAVGIPSGVMGNSEVGHFTMGAGRISFQSLELINQSIKNKSIYKNPAILEAFKKVEHTPKNAVHLLGMISDEGVHSHLNHLFALIEIASKFKKVPVYIHAITDGRDVAEKSAEKYIKMINKKIVQLGLDKPIHKGGPNKAQIATIIGRYYAMDRDNNWDRTQKAYDLYTLGKGTQETDPVKAIKNAYARGAETDYYIDPIILDEHGTIKNKDSIIFFNFRTDRTKQLTWALTGEEKVGFKTDKKLRPYLVCFGDYSKKAKIAFPTSKTKNNLPEVISKAGKTQLHIAETEKFAHVTFFFNSQNEKIWPKEKRILIPSPKCPSYADKPEMSARKITTAVIKEIAKEKFELIIQNFANPDLVGHSGEYKPAVKACEVIDECLTQIIPEALKHGYTILITADHGNSEYMINEKTGENWPAHTVNPVPLLVVSNSGKNGKLRAGGGLEDIAPTILQIMKIKAPKEMTGVSLIK